MSRKPGSIALASLWLLAASPSWAQTAIERGAYLANSVMICGRCHTAPGGPLYAGGRAVETSTYQVHGSNITPDRTTGIGTWSDEEIRRAIVEGERPDGSRLAASMPYGFYQVLTATDIDAIIAYLRSLAPVSNALPAPHYTGVPAPAPAMPGYDRPPASAALDDPLERGRYIGTLARCLACHSSPGADGEPDLVNSLGAGGMPFEGPWGTVVAPDITQRKSGIGTWSDAEIRRALVEGMSRTGRKLAGPMQSKAYAMMSQQDMDALIAWLRSLPGEP